jgi:hypothetical protein
MFFAAASSVAFGSASVEDVLGRLLELRGDER